MEKNMARRTIDDLNDDLMVEILCRLPLNSIIRCLNVYNRWRSLINHGPFVLKNTSTVAAVYDRTHGHSYMYLDGGPSSNQQPLELDFSIAFRDQHRYNYMILASCNGLLFSHVYIPGLYDLSRCYISNPWIKDSLCLPKPTKLCCSSICGLAFENNSQCLVPSFWGRKTDSSRWDDVASYKIVIVHGMPGFPYSEEVTYQFEVYSSRTNKWQLVERPSKPQHRAQVDTKAVYCNRVLYWQCAVEDLALMFNVNTDTSGYLKLPSTPIIHDHHFMRKNPRRRLAECHGQLHYIRISSDCRRLNIWKLSTSSEWMALHDVDLEGAVERSVGLFPMYRKYYRTFKPIYMSREGDDKVFLKNYHCTQIVSYNLKRDEFELVLQSRKPHRVFFFSYSPTTNKVNL